MSKLYIGAGAPEVFGFDIDPGDSGIDLLTVTEVTFVAEKPDGSVVEWETEISDQTTDTLTAIHSFTAVDDETPSELDVAGTWHIYASMVVPGGLVRTATLWVRVEHRFDP